VSDADDLPTLDLSPGGETARLGTEAISEHATRAIEEQGCVRLLHAFEPAFIAELRRVHDRRYARYFPQRDYPDAGNLGHGRTLITIEIAGAFNAPALYANPYTLAIARRVLGADCILGQLATLLTRPGSQDEPLHRGTPSLFGDDRYDAITPAAGIAMALPFATLDGQDGGLRIWPTTQKGVDIEQASRMPSVAAPLPIGSCLLFDLRTVHAGIGNRSDEVRSIATFAYQRHWFRDGDAFDRQPLLSISRRAMRRVPSEYRHLFDWSFDRYARQRPRIALRRLASRVAMPAIEWAQRIAARAR
jgi:hypothetical protein